MIPIKNYFFGKLVDGLDSHSYLHESGTEEFIVANQSARQFKYKGQRTLVDPAVRESVDFLHSNENEVVRLFLKENKESLYYYVRVFPSWVTDRRAIHRYQCIILTPDDLEGLNYNPFQLEKVLPQSITPTGIVWPSPVEHTPEGDIFSALSQQSQSNLDIIPDSLVDSIIDHLARKDRVYFEWGFEAGTVLLSALIKIGIKSGIRIPNIFIGNALTSRNSSLVRGESLFTAGVLTQGNAPLALSRWKRMEVPPPIQAPQKSDIPHITTPPIPTQETNLVPESATTKTTEPSNNDRVKETEKAAGNEFKLNLDQSPVHTIELGASNKGALQPGHESTRKPESIDKNVDSDSKSKELAKRLAHYEQLGYTPQQIEKALKSLEKSSKRRGRSLIVLSLIVAGAIALAYMLYTGLEETTVNLQETTAQMSNLEKEVQERIDAKEEELRLLEAEAERLEAENAVALKAVRNAKDRAEIGLVQAIAERDTFKLRYESLLDDSSAFVIRIQSLQADSLSNSNQIEKLENRESELWTEVQEKVNTINAKNQEINDLENLLKSIKNAHEDLGIAIIEGEDGAILSLDGKTYYLVNTENEDEKVVSTSLPRSRLNDLLEYLAKL